ARAAGALGAAPGGARAPDGRAAAGLSASPRAPGPPRGAARGRCRRWRAGAAADRARGPRRQGRPGAKLLAAMSGGHLSKDFFELVKAIGESRSKQEEDKIIVNEIAVLKQHLSQPAIPPKKMKELHDPRRLRRDARARRGVRLHPRGQADAREEPACEE
ncbi:unnamed protein product, partial [Prorocentrum cordatum]